MTQVQIITEMTTSEMVAEYNKLTGKSIKKFSDRKTGERQLASARNMAETKKLLQGVAAKPKTEVPVKSKSAPKQKPAPRVNIDGRSTAVAASWTNKAVAASRAVRTNVSVAGTAYRSVKEAFEKLNLPLGQHIKFRMELKAEGVKTFEHDGKKYNFKTIEQQSLV